MAILPHHFIKLYIMKRTILSFIQKDPKTGKSARAEAPQIREAKDGRTFTVVVVAGYYDEKEECYFEEDSVAVWGSEEALAEHLKVGRKVLVG